MSSQFETSQIMTHTQNYCVNTFCVLLSLAHSRTQENMEVAHAIFRYFPNALKMRTVGCRR